jgi:hypothetical protein
MRLHFLSRSRRVCSGHRNDRNGASTRFQSTLWALEAPPILGSSDNELQSSRSSANASCEARLAVCIREALFRTQCAMGAWSCQARSIHGPRTVVICKYVQTRHVASGARRCTTTDGRLATTNPVRLKQWPPRILPGADELPPLSRQFTFPYSYRCLSELAAVHTSRMTICTPKRSSSIPSELRDDMARQPERYTP